MPNLDTLDPETVAVVLDDEGNVYDQAYTWESGQSYALHHGNVVLAVRDDGHMTQARAQRLYDSEKYRHDDCWGA